MESYTCYGLTGRMGSGKGELVKIFENLGYKYISLSDMVREEIARMGCELSRAQMQDVGNRLRKEGGAGVLGARVREKILASDVHKWIIDGVRNPAEIAELKKIDAFTLIGVDTSMETLMSRIKSRQRSTDIADDDELIRRMDREWGVGEPEDGQQVGKCMAQADYVLDNNSTLEILKANTVKLLETLHA